MILFLTTADTELLALSHAAGDLPEGLQVRAANPADFTDPAPLNEFLDEELPEARLVVLRLLGGKRAFPGFERVLRHCRREGIPLVAWPGDQEPDPELEAATSAGAEVARRGFLYLLHGGVENMRSLLMFLSDRCLGTDYGFSEPKALPWHGIYRPEADAPLSPREYLERFGKPGRPTVGVLFYRVHWMSRNLDFVDALALELERLGCNALPVFCYSLKSEEGEALPGVFRDILLEDGRSRVDALVSTLSFSMGRIDHESGRVADSFAADALRTLDVPVLQAIVSTAPRARWQQSRQGLGPVDAAMNVAMPEFDGRILSVPISFKEDVRRDPRLRAPLRRYVPLADRVRFTARLARNYALLRRKPNAEKRVAILLTNYPSKNARIGNAVGLDTPASVVRILEAMRESGYAVGPIPEDGDALIRAIIERCSNDSAYLTEEQLALAAGHLRGSAYRRRFDTLHPETQAGLREAWGDPPGEVLTYEGDIVIPGIQLGNVFVGVQPPRGFGENPIAVYHSPDLVPTHQYVGYYEWLRREFGADAVVHVGKHGTLEWLPGKGVGLSEACYPEVVLDDLPNFYPYIINNPGEGTQAKRRSHATIVDHMIPPMTTAESYDELAALEQLLDQYYQVQTLDPSKLEMLQRQIWETIVRASLDRDLGERERPCSEAFDDFLTHVDGYLCELKAAQIRDGLHVLGRLPDSAGQWADLVLALTRLPNGTVPALPAALGSALGIPGEELLRAPGERVSLEPPAALQPFLRAAQPSVGHVAAAIEALATELLLRLLAARTAGDDGTAAALARLGGAGERAGELRAVLEFISQVLLPRLEETEREIERLLQGLCGRFVPPGPSGAPTRGMADILPTGRNFYSIDPRAVPSPAAWLVGERLAAGVVERFLGEEGRYPESVGIVVWGTAAMRTQGDDVAEALALLGVRPVWQRESRRVVGIEPVPLAELGRPRVDVTIRMSGFFRDAFPSAIHLLDRAVRLVAALEEPVDQNFVRKHFLEERLEKLAQGVDPKEAEETSLLRIFGAKPGSYGSGILPLIESRNWQDDQDLARVYVAWSGYAYTERRFGVPAAGEFRLRLGRADVATKNQDNREHDIFDSDDYFQDHGGMVATIRAITGKNPRQYFGDSHLPGRVDIRDLADEARRVFRSRVVNPKWLASIRKHGYRGAMELAATVDFLFGYDVTAGVVDDWMYAKVSRSYVADPEMRAFVRESNPWALKDMAERLLEAAARGLWESPEPGLVEELRRAVLDAEESLEGLEEGES